VGKKYNVRERGGEKISFSDNYIHPCCRILREQEQLQSKQQAGVPLTSLSSTDPAVKKSVSLNQFPSVGQPSSSLNSLPAANNIGVRPAMNSNNLLGGSMFGGSGMPAGNSVMMPGSTGTGLLSSGGTGSGMAATGSMFGGQNTAVGSLWSQPSHTAGRL
jgi:hypothetical protein